MNLLGRMEGLSLGVQAAQLRLQLLVLLVCPQTFGKNPNRWYMGTAKQIQTEPVTNRTTRTPTLRASMLQGMITSPAELVQSPRRKGLGNTFRMALS